MKNDNQSLNLRTDEQNSLLWLCHNRERSVECGRALYSGMV